MLKFKKAIAVMLSAVMMLSVGAMPITVNADTIERNTYGFSVYGDFLYEIMLETNLFSPGVCIYEYMGTDTEVVVPSEINGIPVVAISGDRPFKDNMTSIILPNTIEYIGRGTFRNCKSLKSIVIPDSVTIIIDEAFIGCTALESVVFGHGISTIGDIFQGCTRLK
ncbi:MAG: leucine-rich repeat domain-containing protein, partial [Ruminococcus sp.]|nr:leucine-rich repeat domain-containing protein [Ruminococcus sp.]